MAVLKKTRITELLTAEAGIKLSGGVLTAPSGTINNLTSNTITVNTSVNVGSNTTLTSDSISTDTAEFNTITATTYNNLPRADETTEGIVMLSDTYSSGASNTAASVIALSEFATSVEDRITEFELDIRGSSDDAYNKEPPTLYSVKAYADYMSITGGSVNTSIPDNGTMTLKKTGASSLTLSLKNFALQSNLETLKDQVDLISGGSLTQLDDLIEEVSRLTSILPETIIPSGQTVLDVINDRLGWTDASSVQNKLDELDNKLSSDINNLTSSLNQLEGTHNSDISNLTNEISLTTGRINSLSENITSLTARVNNTYTWISHIPSIRRFEATASSGSSGGKPRVTLSALGVTSLTDAANYIFIVCLNGFVLRGPKWFPSATGNASISNGEYIFVRGADTANSYVETTNSLLANQEMLVIAFGYNASDFNVSAASLASLQSDVSPKSASKLLW